MNKVWQQKDFINTCVRVNSEQSEKLQERLFKLGWHWYNNSDKQNSFNFNYLYVDKNKILSAYNYFNENTQFKLIRFEDIVFQTEFRFGDKINYIGNNLELKGSGTVFDITNTEIIIEYINGEQAKAPVEDFKLLQEFDIINTQLKITPLGQLHKNLESYTTIRQTDTQIIDEILKVDSYYDTDSKFKDIAKAIRYFRQTDEDILNITIKKEKDLKYIENLKNRIKCERVDDIVNESVNKVEGYKENSDKLSVEYSWEFLEEQLKRIGKNKDKYEKNNWKKTMNVEELKSALFRHTLNVMKDNYKDNDEEFGHLAAIAINASFIYHQLKNYGLE